MARQKKTVFLVGLIAICLLLVGMYVFASISAWESYQREAGERRDEVRSEAQRALTMQVKTDDDRQKKKNAFIAASTAIKEGNERCKQAMMYAWQQNLPMYRSLVEKCEAQLKKEELLAKQLDTITSYLRDEQKIVAIIGGVSTAKDGLPDSEWVKIAEQWQGAVIKTKELQVDTDLSKTKELTITRLGAVHASWQALIDAHQKKDRAKYEAAVGELAKAYEGLQEVPQSSQESFKTKAEAVEAAYRQAFSGA